MPYSDFSTEDFVKDSYFQAWVLQDDPEVNSFWELWIELYPEKEKTVSAAMEILLEKNIQNIPVVSEKQVKKAWEQLNKTIAPKVIPITNAAYSGATPQKTVSWRLMAAAVAGLVMLAFGFLYYREQHKILTYTSVNSQIMPITLPDGSEVILNANSSVAFKKHWAASSPREVWLKGEAFFSVTKKPLKGQPTFTVHANKVQVQVLGTQFNVADRATKTQVILNSGKIKLMVADAHRPTALTMLPGDYVALNKTNEKIIKLKVNPEAFSGWRSQKLQFKNTPLAEIIAQIEQTYGTKIILTDTSLLDRTFTGTFPNNNLPVLLQTLEKAFQLQINQKGQTLTFIKN
ncbi:FecR family protein [Adhaeribacter rhizoryzae]|uniref:DUF4974 domain-containing protein n=1 Tax=Adhaeribacter rhizoryzae TaxID=2607907 RepID=A0A5M6DKA4_9BACT|nr:FecR domain-containing protein [Adhaeribacter rhizoryzae]KAA5546806.1 DUF4974 domain-containing protein [Adhaeribacter rhizoryzae]